MGEKETGAVDAGAPSALASGGRESSAPSVSERTSVKSGKSNSSDIADARGGDDGEGSGTPDPVEASNLNQSKSNINRPAQPDDGGVPTPSEGAIVKSKSNISNNRESAPGDGGGGQPGIAIGDPGVNGNIAPAEDEGGGTSNPIEASNLNLSKSNINRDAQPGAGGAPPSSETAIIKSKSNITNN